MLTAILSKKKFALGVYKTRGGEYIYNRIRVGEGARAIRFPCRGKWNCLLWHGREVALIETFACCGMVDCLQREVELSAVAWT